MNPMNAELLKIVMQMRKLDWTSPDGIVWLVSNTFFEPVITSIQISEIVTWKFCDNTASARWILKPYLRSVVMVVTAT